MTSDGIIKIETDEKTSAKLVVLGIGGGGGNAVNWMIESQLEGVEYIAINTDAQDLANNNADNKIRIGEKITGGLGAGGNPEKGQASAEESIEEIENAIKGADMLFLTAGMGGGTGTGAAPIIAKLARELDILTVGIVTKPFSFEGKKRKDNADLGIDYLKQYVDSLVVIPNDKLLMIADKNTSVEDALMLANEVLKQGVQGVTDIIIKPGLMSKDFADICTVMTNRGTAHMGIGVGRGEDKVKEAVRAAIENPLLETSIDGAKAVLLNITGGHDLTMFDVNEAADHIEQLCDREVILIFGTAIYEDMSDTMEITVIATGFGDPPISEKTEPDEEKTEKTEVKVDNAQGSVIPPEPKQTSVNKGDHESYGYDPDKDDLVKDKDKEDEPVSGPEKEKSPLSFLDDNSQDDDSGERFGFQPKTEPEQESLEFSELTEEEKDDRMSGLVDSIFEEEDEGPSRFKVPDFLKRD